MLKKVFYLAFMFLFLTVMVACSQASTQPSESTPEEKPEKNTKETESKELPKVAFVYIGVPGDGGWTFEHDKGRQQVKNRRDDAGTAPNVKTGYCAAGASLRAGITARKFAC